MDRVLFVSFCAVLLAGCNGPAAPAPEDATFALVSQRVLSNCTTRSCHGAEGRRGDLVLTPDMAYAALVNVPAANTGAKAKGKQRVVPGRPDDSFLLQKLTGPGPDEGARMPLTGDALPPEDLALVRAWIAAGAKP
jgi:mono/diheme cytochrome c family protein